MLKYIRRFFRAKSGLAAVEFGLIAPVLGTLLVGTVELCNALECHQKVTMLASTAADLVTQSSTISGTDINNIFNATTAIIYPFPVGSTQITVTEINSDGNGGGIVAWSVTRSGTSHTNYAKHALNAAMTVPTGLMTKAACALNACSIILSEVTYSYTSPLGKFFLGSVNMTDTFYSRPRKVAKITYTG